VKKYVASVLSLALLCGLISGCSQSGPKGGLSAPSTAIVLAENYVRVKAIRGDIKKTVRSTSPSILRSVDAATAYFNVSGTIATVDVTWGTQVKPGDIIATLVESADYKITLAKAKQALDIAKIGLDQAKTAAEGGGEVALAQLKWQQADIAYQNSGNKDEQLRLNAEKSKAAYENLVLTAQNTYSDLQHSYQIVNDQFMSAQANYDSCFLKAPVGGEITWLSRSLSEGSSVHAYEQIATIENNSGLVHIYSGSSSDSQYLSDGDVVTVITTNTGMQYQGRILFTPKSIPADINYNLGGKTESFNYFIKLTGFDYSKKSNGDGGGDLEILLKSSKDAVLVESYLIKSQKDENGLDVYYVLVLMNGAPIRKPITIGIANKDYTEVTSGITEGTEVVYLPS